MWWVWFAAYLGNNEIYTYDSAPWFLGYRRDSGRCLVLKSFCLQPKTFVSVAFTVSCRMSNCRGDQAVSARIDQSMKDFLEEEANRCGVTKAELIRRVFDDYRASRESQMKCPHCENEIMLDPCP